MADDDKKTPAQKAGAASKAAHSNDVVSGDFPQEGETITKDGEFAGNVRYEGTVLVERKVGEDWVTVMTDAPRPGDRVQQHTLDLDTGERGTSTESVEKSGANRMPGKS